MVVTSGISTVSQAEIVRASFLMRNHPATKILNSRIVPRWIDGGRRFWYRRELTCGHDHVLVDVRSGAKELAFDHDCVASAITHASGVEVAAEALVLTQFDGRYARVEIGRQPWCCDVSSLAVTALPDRSSMLISPDGTKAVSLNLGNLILHDLGLGEDWPLTEDGEPDWGYGLPSDRFGQNKLARDRNGIILPPVQTWWSPDNRHVVTARLDQRHVAPYPYVENAPGDGSFRPKLHSARLPLMGEQPATLDYWVIDTVSRRKWPLNFPVERMLASNNGIDDLKVAWSANGMTLLAISVLPGFDGGEALAADLASGTVKTILVDRSSPGNPLVAGGYGRPVARFINGGRELLWWSTQGGEWGHIWRYCAASGKLLNRVTDGDWLVRDIVAVDEDRRHLWFTAMGREAGNPYHRYLYRIGFDGDGLQLMTPESGDHMIVDPIGSDIVFDGAGPTAVVAPDFQTFVYDVSTVSEPSRTLLRRADGSLLAEVESASTGALLEAGYRPPEEVTALAADGESQLHGLVYRPSDHDPAGSYPIIDVEYGNPAVAITPRTFAHAATFAGTAATPAALAELGFIVVVLDARGTPYRNRRFSHPDQDYLKTMGLEDHMAFIRSVARNDRSLDLDRIGIVGQSFGGYTAVCGVLRFPHFFSVAVAGAPQLAYHNMGAEDVLTCSRGLPIYADGSNSRGSEAEVPGNFADLNLAVSLDQLVGQVLIIAGELDENVYPGTIQQFFARAVRDDRNVELIWLPGAAHDALFTRYALRRSIDFLLRHLQNRALPADVSAFPDPSRVKTTASY